MCWAKSEHRAPDGQTADKIPREQSYICAPYVN